METETLITLILEERKAKQDKMPGKGQAYFMLNVNNPVVRVLYEAWKEKTNYKGAPGERERTAFELEMMSVTARQLLEQHFEMVAMLREDCRIQPEQSREESPAEKIIRRLKEKEAAG